LELKYIWTDTYRVLENLNINFYHQGKHCFSYNNNTLKPEEKIKSPLDFGKKVSGVTAIAGPNGSGKSSLCELIFEIAATLANGGMSYNMTFKGILIIGDRIFYHQDLVIENVEQLKELGYTTAKYDKTPLERIIWEERIEFFKLGFIYYSNALDWRSDIRQVNLANYSTEALLTEDIRTGTGYLPDDQFGKQEIPDFIGAYYQGQGYRHTRFFLNFSGYIPFNAPETFILNATYSGNNRALNYKRIFDYDDYKVFDELEKEILLDIFPSYQQPEPEEKIAVDQQVFKTCALRLYRFNLLMAVAVMKHTLPNLEEARGFTYQKQIPENLFGDVPQLELLLTTHERLIALGNFYDKWEPYYIQQRHQFDNWRFFALEWFKITNTDETVQLLRSLMNMEENVINGDTYYFKRLSNYHIFPQNSSGEYNFYTLFSRLYDAVQRNIRGFDEREHMVLVLDEADLGYHPVWKKKLLNWVIKFLNEEFNPYKFQVILTTHSPYLLSDLSAEHLILLNNLEGKTKVLSSEGRMTFGANINELLADSFFMSDGLIGDFAKEKIQKVIDDLNKWLVVKEENGALEVSSEDRSQCFMIISLIGDQIVRNKLFEMYWDLFNDQDALDNEIDILSDRIAYLKSLKK